MVHVLAVLVLSVLPGGSLYVKDADAPLLKDPSPRARVLSKLPLGTEVRWLGPSAKDKSLHEVEVGGKRGFLKLTWLTPNKPLPELLPAPATSADPKVSHSLAEEQTEARLLYLEDLNAAKR